MKKIALIAVFALLAGFAGLQAADAACKQRNEAGGNDSLLACDVFKSYTTKLWVGNNANVTIVGSHTALSNLNLGVGDDVEGFIGVAGAASNEVTEETSVNTADIILEMPTSGATEDVDQENNDDDSVLTGTVVDQIVEDISNNNDLYFTEVETTLADNSANIGIGDDFENSSVTVKDGNKNKVTKTRLLNAFSLIRASSVSVEL